MRAKVQVVCGLHERAKASLLGPLIRDKAPLVWSSILENLPPLFQLRLFLRPLGRLPDLPFDSLPCA